MMFDHKASCHEAPTLLVKATKDKTPIEAYTRWSVLSNTTLKIKELPIAHGVVCANENVSTLAEVLMEFLENHKA